MQTCKTCFRIVDVGELPIVTRNIPARAGLPGFVQVDVNCPGCGGLLSRSIDGVLVGKLFKDDRPDKAARAAKSATAKSTRDAKAATEAKVKTSK